jgi:hypothetical protein
MWTCYKHQNQYHEQLNSSRGGMNRQSEQDYAATEHLESGKSKNLFVPFYASSF